jgi:hypothetical protein
MNLIRKKEFGWALLLVLLTAAGISAAPPASPPATVVDRMEHIAGRLLLNDRQLKEIYRDLHGFAQYSLDGPDSQLDYIQKLYLTVDRARMQGYYLWRILSVFDYLEHRRKGDFLTLYEVELRRAAEDCRLSVTLIELYAAYVEKEQIRNTVREAAGLLEANIYMYEELGSLLAPYVNKPPYPRRIE